ncbi:hypothetical protein AWZ03_011127 [Drosophila navojoa]|uniref:Uncharacterized protein n=1 Tax=Drosophila navojoa TaxID=7232 RepID=A0A484B143_DRONA|nr:hypothetical protein AWZ03_011127 [Drosophila navojoa]
MKKCLLCRSDAEDELRLGKLYIHGDIIVHQNCLYLSSNLIQRGNSRNGILNFTYKDIMAEWERTKCVICCFCHTGGANIGCCKAGCRRSFHTYCGVENRVQNQFIGTFKSFCNMHVNTYNETPKTDEQCAICFEDLLKRRERFCRTQHIFGKCCKNGWYHKDCLQRYANSAGYFFKCPLCNDITEFKTVTFWGISVPNRDALWEDNDAYADQMEIPTDCVAQNCVNPSGRKGNLRTLLYCLLCGSNPSHTMCTMMKSEDYCCEACSGVLHKPDEAKPNKEHNDADPLEDFVFRANTIRLNPTNQPQTETQAPQPQTLTLLCAQDTSDSEDSSGSDSDSESDFDCFLSQLSKQTNEKENVDMAGAVPTIPPIPAPVPVLVSAPAPVLVPAPPVSGPSPGSDGSPPPQLRQISIPATPQPQAQPLNINMIPSIDEPLRMRNRRRTAPTARRAQDTATEPRRLRSRSNNNRGRPSLSPEAVDRRNNNEERGSARNRRRTQNDAENTNTGTSRGRSRIRTFGSQVRSRGPSPLDISCVANRTRARSRK